MNLGKIVDNQREYFYSGQTKQKTLGKTIYIN